MGLVAYLAHPIGELDDFERVGDNFANAMDWVRFFADSTNWAIIAPWHLYSISIGASIYGPRRLADQLAVLDRADILILCGGYVSPHMHAEIRRAHRNGTPVLDLSMLGVTPPAKDEDAATLVLARAHRVVVTRPRRVWLPLLTTYDIESLKDARHALYTHMPEDHAAAVRIVDRIIAAAFESVG